MVSFRAVVVIALATVAVKVSGQGFGFPSFGMSNQAQAGSSGSSSGGSNGAFGLTIPGLAGSSFSIKSTPASRAIGGSVVIEENGIKLPIQLGPAGGIQAEIVAPILPSITDLIKLAQKGFGNFGGILSNVINQANNVASSIVNNIQSFLKAVGQPIETLIKGAGSLINKAVKEGFITAGKAKEIVTSIIQSALSNSLNQFAKLVDVVQYAINAKLMLEEEGLSLIAEAAKQGVHQIGNGIDWSLEGFLNATAQAKIINNNVANTLKGLLTGNSTSNGASQLTASGSGTSSSGSAGAQNDLQVDVTVTDS